MSEIEKIIHKAQNQHHTLRWQRAALVFPATLVIAMVLAAVMDREWMFAEGARWIGWTAGLIAAAWAASRAAGSASPNSTELAHQVESQAGETTPVVATALDPAVRQTASQDEVGRVLLERLDQRAKEAVHKAPLEFKGRLKTPLSLLFIAAVSLWALGFFQGWQGLTRMLIPWQDSPYTTLALEGPAEPVVEGKAFTVHGKVSGMAVNKVVLYRKDSGTPIAEVVPDPNGNVKFELEGLHGPTVFRAKAGDGHSEPLHFEPYYLPTIESFKIAVTHPGYSESKADIETQPSFSVFRGSQVHYRIHLKAPATGITVEQTSRAPADERITDKERANLVRGAYGVMVGKADSPSEEPALPEFQPVAGEPLIWETHWQLPTPGNIVYRLAIVGERGDMVRNDEPWRINILADDPPTIHIENHNGGEVIKLGNETVQFDLRASDDVGLAKARMVFRKPGDEHAEKSIPLPPEAFRTWDGASLLDLAPLKLSPLDIVAVHAEVEDTNTVDGPGIGRSEIVFLEVPFPESDEDGGGGGGGGGGGSEPINPLELQMEILRSTMALQKDAPTEERESLAHDQRQNAGYTAQIEGAMNGPGLEWLAAALRHARESMEKASELLDTQPATKAIPEEEAALGFLVDAAKLLDDAVKEGLLPANCQADGMTFTLRPPKPSSSDSESEESEEGKAEEALRELVEEVKRQLAEQETLNQGEMEAEEQADRQGILSMDALTAARQARGMPASGKGRGDPKAAAEALERASELQEDTVSAMEGGDNATSAELGTKSAEALDEALEQLSAQMEVGGFASESHPPGFERLVNDYLRSISYE